VLKQLRGDKGTKVTVGIMRRGLAEIMDFTITRDKIPLFSVDASYMASPEIGYIRINRFADETVNEFRVALKKLKENGMKSLVLDLSGNGGGYLNRAIELADEFLSDRKLVVYTEGRTNSRQESYSTSAGGFEQGKLVILIDETSASASEIVSGAVQDWDRGLIIGRRSFGKGLVQKPYSLPDGSAVRLTVARYYTPSGRSIQKPYIPGEEEDYDLDFSNRYKHGEYFSADSIRFDDSLKFYTNNKRVVFGGGGIMPDIFVPLDTSMNSKYYTDLLRKGIFNEFTLTFADNNRNSILKQYPDIATYRKNFFVDDNLLEKFIAAGEKADIERDSAGLAVSDKLIRTQLKALIARNLWNIDAYYQVINDINSFYKKAVEAIQDNTFEKLKIAER
jgi:carboxyl-terminal processing protease